MIIMKLMGGLGNQLFQYAFSKELAWLYNEEVVFDIDSYPIDKQTHLDIKKFNVDDIIDWKSVINEEDRKKIQREEKIYRVLQRILRIIHNNDKVGKKTYQIYLRKGRYFNFDPYFYSIPKLSNKLKVAYGYFQGEDYFRDVKDQILKEFHISLPESSDEKLYSNQIVSSNSVCVHIRAGDYKKFKNRRFDVTTPDYFKRSVAYIYEHIDNPSFFVFTNASNLELKDYGLRECTFIQGMKDFQDFRLMTQCKHFIISNSTFSWWASYLSTNNEKIIVVPQKWRRNQFDEPAIMKSTGIDYVHI